MKYGSLVKRLDDIQPGECPGCKALAALSDEELDQQLKALVASIKSGEPLPEGFQDLPEHRPGCPEAGGDKELSPEEIEALIKSCEEIMEFRPPEDPDKDICPWCKRHIPPDHGGYTGPETNNRRICHDCYSRLKRDGQRHQYSAPGPDTPNPGPDVLKF